MNKEASIESDHDNDAFYGDGIKGLTEKTVLACDNDDDRTGAYKSRGQEKYLIDTEQVGHPVVQGSNQAPLLDQRYNVSKSGGDPAASLFVEFLKLLGAVCLVFRGGTVLDSPPALHL